MSKDEKYNGLTRVWRRYGLLFKGLMNTYGFVKALEHHIKSRTEIDEDFIQELKEKYTKLDIENYGESVKQSYVTSGYATEAKVTENSVEISLGLCPFYDGFAQAGLSHDIIKTVCEKASEYSYALHKKHFPEYEGILEFRETADDCCIEGFRLTM
jgi:hypothetical protein